MSAGRNRLLAEPAITINGRALTHTQAGALRVALQFARRDLEAAPKDLIAVGVKQRVDDILQMIDETEVTI